MSTTADILPFPSNRPLGTVAKQQTFFGDHSLTKHVKDILVRIAERFQLQGLILYAADFDDQSLHLRSTANHDEIENKELYSIQLPFDKDRASSFASLIFNSKSMQESEDCETDERFNQSIVKKVGVSGRAIGYPIVTESSCYGVLIAWTGENPITDNLRTDLLEQAVVLAALIAKANHHELRLDLLAKFSEFLWDLDSFDGLHSLADRCLNVGVSSGFDRCRIFSLNDDKNSFSLIEAADRSYSTEYDPTDPQYHDFKFDLESNPYLNRVVETAREQAIQTQSANVSCDRQNFAYLFRSEDFGKDPNADIFNRPNNLPWVVTPILSAQDNGCIGFISADNLFTFRAIMPENMAYILTLSYLVSSATEKNKIPRSSISKQLEKYLLPIFSNDAITKTPLNYDLFISDDNKPVCFYGPDYSKIHLNLKNKTDMNNDYRITKKETETFERYKGKISEIFNGHPVYEIEPIDICRIGFGLTVGEPLQYRLRRLINNNLGIFTSPARLDLQKPELLPLRFKNEEELVKFLEASEPRRTEFIEMMTNE